MNIESINFFTQKIKMNNYQSRLEYFKKVLNGNILHIGCADYPIYSNKHNLHLWLLYNVGSDNNKVKEIDGYDVNKETILLMKTHEFLKDKNLYYEKPNKKYDFLLIPETIEHVDNINLFLLDILDLMNDECEVLITGPNAFCNNHIQKNKLYNNDLFIEEVHPDHNCWFSPYTLFNVIRKTYTKLNTINFTPIECGLLEKDTMAYVLFKIKKQ